MWNVKFSSVNILKQQIDKVGCGLTYVTKVIIVTMVTKAGFRFHSQIFCVQDRTYDQVLKATTLVVSNINDAMMEPMMRSG